MSRDQSLRGDAVVTVHAANRGPKVRLRAGDDIDFRIEYKTEIVHNLRIDLGHPGRHVYASSLYPQRQHGVEFQVVGGESVRKLRDRCEIERRMARHGILSLRCVAPNRNQSSGKSLRNGMPERESSCCRSTNPTITTVWPSRTNRWVAASRVLMTGAPNCTSLVALLTCWLS